MQYHIILDPVITAPGWTNICDAFGFSHGSGYGFGFGFSNRFQRYVIQGTSGKYAASA